MATLHINTKVQPLTVKVLDYYNVDKKAMHNICRFIPSSRLPFEYRNGRLDVKSEAVSPKLFFAVTCLRLLL